MPFYPKHPDPDAFAHRNAVFAAGGTMSGERFNLNTLLIRSLKASTVWPTLDRLWLFAAENSTQALIDLKARATATAVNSPVFTAGRGFAGNGSTSYINSGFNASTAGGNYGQNSGTLGTWVETADTTSTHRLFGNDSFNASELAVGSPNYSYGVNQAALAPSNIAVATTGLLLGTRTASNAIAFYSGATQQATGSNASVALANNNTFFLAGNNAGTPFVPGSAREALGVIAGGWTAAQVAAFFAPVRAYMTALPNGPA